MSRAYDVLVKGLRHQSTRQQVAASNLANLQTPGFKARVAKFDSAFESALERGDVEAALEAQPKVVERDDVAPDATGNTVDLETEVQTLRDASLKHRAMTRMIELQVARLKLAVGQ